MKKLICRMFGHKYQGVIYNLGVTHICKRCLKERSLWDDVAKAVINISDNYHLKERKLKIIK